MSRVRRAWIDVSPGETRGVVELDGRAEHLLIDRDGEAPFARLGETYVGRVVSTTAASAFVDIGLEPAGWIDGASPAYAVGARVAVEVVAERRAEKGPRLRFVAGAEGGPRRLVVGPSLEASLLRLTGQGGEAPGRGDGAREVAERAQEAVLATTFGFKGGLTLAIEPTRALVAVDVDVAAPRASALKEANLRALRESARLSRLKALGGLIAIDLAGLDPAPGLMRAEAAAAFAIDGPDVRVWPLAASGLLLVSKPHGRRPVAERLCDAAGRTRPETLACALLRDLERTARSEPGARLCIQASAAVAALLSPAIQRLGPQFCVQTRLGGDVLAADIVRL